MELSNITYSVKLAEELKHRTLQGFAMIYVCLYFNNKATILPPPVFLCISSTAAINSLYDLKICTWSVKQANY